MTNPSIPVAIHEQDDGTLIIDVDENLHGEERTKAVMEVLRPWLRGDLGIVPIPLLLAAWAVASQWLGEHVRAAAAVAVAATTAAAGAAALGILESPPIPQMSYAAPSTSLATLTMTVNASPVAASPTVSVPRTPRPSRTPRTTPPVAPVRATGQPPTLAPEPASTPRPSRTSRATPTVKPTSKRTATATARPTVEAADAEIRPPTHSGRPQPAPTVETPASPEPEPAATAGCNGLVGLEIELGGLGGGVCLLDRGA